jgi:ComF family protein
MRTLLGWLADAIFPLACCACSRPLLAQAAQDGALCAPCRAAAPPPPPPLCPRCGVPLDDASANLHGTCGVCRLHPPAFASARGAALYDPEAAGSPLVTAIHAFKYRAARSLAQPLATLLVERLPPPPGALLIPVPLHPTRLRERRYNQSALLARAVARLAGQAYELRALVRRVSTPPQAGLCAAERRANLAAAFAARDARLVRGRLVVLIDDVITTGATADACARALLAAGADRVDVRAVGRTPPPRRA